MKGPSSGEIWRKVKVLVIDEISMVDAEFLDWYLSQLPPHGIQLIFCGDFMQLPPVPDHQGTLDRCTHSNTPLAVSYYYVSSYYYICVLILACVWAARSTYQAVWQQRARKVLASAAPWRAPWIRQLRTTVG